MTEETLVGAAGRRLDDAYIEYRLLLKKSTQALISGGMEICEAKDPLRTKIIAEIEAKK